MVPYSKYVHTICRIEMGAWSRVKVVWPNLKLISMQNTVFRYYTFVHNFKKINVSVLLLLRPMPWASATDFTATQGASKTFKKSMRLLKDPYIAVLLFTFAYIGISLGFFSGVYGSCLGFTKSFGTDAKSLVGQKSTRVYAMFQLFSNDYPL